MQRIRGNLSYANVAATLALVFAMSGGAIAATGGFTAASNSIKACAGSGGVLKLQTGKKCKKGQRSVAWNQQGVPGAKGATGVSGIAELKGAPVPNATNATSATTALTANNALSLDGVPASEFTHNDCTSETGQVKGFAEIPEVISTSFTPVARSYSCSGEQPEARKTGNGLYRFHFPGGVEGVPLVTAVGNGDSFETSASVGRVGPSEWEVSTWSGNDIPLNEGVSLVLF